jgi:cytochrome P450
MSQEIAALHDPLVEITNEFLSNPHPTFAKMRSEAPIFWSNAGQYWIVTRYAEAKEILGSLKFQKNVQRWQQTDPLIEKFPEMREVSESHKHWMLNMDPPDHSRLRALLNKAFTPLMVSQMRSHIQDIANDLIDRIEARGEVDAISEYTFPLPIIVIAEMMGIPHSDRDKFKEWSHAIVSTTAPSGIPAPGGDLSKLRMNIAAHQELVRYFKPIVEERRKTPREDLISVLVHAEEDGHKLSEEELLANLILLLVAGHETTTNLIANGIYSLLTHPDQLLLLKEKPELIESAVYEILRFEGPIQLVRRLAGEDIELGGQHIKKGDMVVVMLGACNRDPNEFENPDKFDITRFGKKHLAFSHGIHRCIGGHLAEAEGQIALQTIFTRLPDLRLKTDKVKWCLPFELHGLKELPVVF